MKPNILPSNNEAKYITKQWREIDYQAIMTENKAANYNDGKQTLSTKQSWRQIKNRTGLQWRGIK